MAGNLLYELRYFLTDLQEDELTDSVVRVHLFASLQRAGLRVAEEQRTTHAVAKDEAHAETVRQRELQRRMIMLKQVDLLAPLSDEERQELAEDPEAEHRELAAIYVSRGLDARLAAEVARQLAAKDALAAHARDELGISERLRARPIQAALASGSAFASGSLLPLVTAMLAPAHMLGTAVAALSLPFLAALGAIAARIGHASMAKGAWRVTFWGAIAMGLTAAVGLAFEAA